MVSSGCRQEAEKSLAPFRHSSSIRVDFMQSIKKTTWVATFVTLILILVAETSVAQRRGGGRAAGGFSRGGGGGNLARSIPSHAPTMSRPVTRPNSLPRPSAGKIPKLPSGGGKVNPGVRPAAGNRPTAKNYLDLPSINQRPKIESRPVLGGKAGDLASKLPNKRPGGEGSKLSRDALGDFFDERPATRPTLRPEDGKRPVVQDRPGLDEIKRPSQRLSNRPERIEDWGQREQWREERRDQIRDDWNDYHPRWDFWKDHPDWARWRWNRPYRWATWAVVTSWFPWGWSQPVYYSYGDNVYYEGDQVYYGDEVVATSEEYAQQAEDIALSAPAEIPEDSEWLTLGVFAVTQDGQGAETDPTLLLQLAVSKDGVVAGTLFNSKTEESQEIEGMVDRETQRVAFVVSGKTTPIMETGMQNLTEDEAPALLHFENGETQQWLLVRLEEPEEAKSE